MGACSVVCACIYMESRGGGREREREGGREAERERARDSLLLLLKVYAQLSTQGAKCSTPGDLHHKCWENIVERNSQAETQPETHNVQPERIADHEVARKRVELTREWGSRLCYPTPLGILLQDKAS